MKILTKSQAKSYLKKNIKVMVAPVFPRDNYVVKSKGMMVSTVDELEEALKNVPTVRGIGISVSRPGYAVEE